MNLSGISALGEDLVQCRLTLRDFKRKKIVINSKEHPKAPGSPHTVFTGSPLRVDLVLQQHLLGESSTFWFMIDVCSQSHAHGQITAFLINYAGTALFSQGLSILEYEYHHYLQLLSGLLKMCPISHTDTPKLHAFFFCLESVMLLTQISLFKCVQSY